MGGVDMHASHSPASTISSTTLQAAKNGDDNGDAAQLHSTSRTLESGATSDAGTATAIPNPSQRVAAQIQAALKLKEEGNALFQKGDKMGAMQKWHHALLNSSGINSLASQYGSRSSEEENKQAQLITLTVQNNLASCYLADKRYEKVIYATTKVLSMDDNNVKALYRRAKAYKELGNQKKAATDLDKALTIAPNDSNIRALSAELVKAEEIKLAEQKKKLNGFLKGKSLGNDVAVEDAPEKVQGE